MIKNEWNDPGFGDPDHEHLHHINYVDKLQINRSETIYC